MLAGISTACLYPLPTDESLRRIAWIRPGCAEVFLNAMRELTPEYLGGLRSIARDAGIAITSVHPYYSVMEPMLFFSQYGARLDEGIELYKRFFEAALLLGADAVVFHGDHKGSFLPRNEYFERFYRVWREAKHAGISLCQENVERCVSGSASFLADMRKALPDAEYILDIKQAVRSGEDPLELARIMGGRVKHIHMSDHNAGEECLLPGDGVFNIGEFLTDMRRTGFCGGVIVELYRQNFTGIVELSRGFQHLSGIVSTLS